MNLSDRSEVSGLMSVKDTVGDLNGKEGERVKGPRGRGVIVNVCRRSVAERKDAMFDEYCVYAICRSRGIP